MTKSGSIEPILSRLNEVSVITEPEKNLRSKMDSLLRSIENLTAKKLRLDYELKRQKRSLARKRLELKKVTKLTVRIETAQEIGSLNEQTVTAKDALTTIDNYLFQESARILDS